MHKRLFMKSFLFCMILFSSFVSASIHETLPSYHWSYEYIKTLQNRGYCLDLLQMHQPYTRGAVAKSLISIENSFKIRGENDFLKKIVEKLVIEFTSEMNVLKGITEESDHIHFRSHIRSYLDDGSEENIVYRGIFRGGVGVSVGKHVYAHSTVNFDQYDYHNPNYKGDKWNGFAGYTEQAYLNSEFKSFQFKLGRDFLKWGPGESGTLILSDISRPLDQFYASMCFGPFKYSFITSQLDPYPDSADSSGFPIRRFFSGHRLDASFFNNRLQVAVSEIIFYGGPNRTVDFTYLNPFIFYHGAHRNKSDETNVLPTLDVLFYPRRNLQIYGSLLLDDIQIEKKIPSDLEPDEIGFIIGSRWADPIGISGMAVSGEYVRIANRTYKTPSPWETFIHRNDPLGHPLGNDFDYWHINASKWFLNNVRMQIQYSTVRKGEGSLFTEWDTPWMAYTVEQGYSEPFPTGIVEHRKQLDLSIRFYPSVHWGLEADVQLYSLTNVGHVEGEKRNEAVWRVGFWWDGDFKIKL